MYRFSYILFFILIFVGCQPVIENKFLVSLIVDGREITYVLTESITVEEFLSQPDVKIDLNTSDRLSPPRFTQLTDGMRITIVRVTEEATCEVQEIAYQQEIIQNEGLAVGEERVAQIGQNGQQEVCFKLIREDGVIKNRVQVGQPTVLIAPINEVVIVGIQNQTEPIAIQGTLTYINNKNAWVITGNSTSKRPLTTTGNLDSLVLSLSLDGRYLLFTAKPINNTSFVNELWFIETIGNASPIQLVPTDVLYAEWVPTKQNTISYSTSEVQQIFPFWRALNNLFIMQVDLSTGKSLNITSLLEESSGGLSGWWGTVFQWSPNGETLGWVRADSMGIVKGNQLIPLLQYPFFRTTQNWSWRSNISWSSDSSLIATISHGAPIGSEPPENSPVFDVLVADADGTFKAIIHESAGMWSSPKFSPIKSESGGLSQGSIAYLRSREPYNSVSGEYDLVVADRDGSNARAIFPKQNQPGIKTKDFGLTPQDFTWSPDGKYIAVIYQGNLWIVDVTSTVAYQLTFDGQSEHPVWSQ